MKNTYFTLINVSTYVNSNEKRNNTIHFKILYSTRVVIKLLHTCISSYQNPYVVNREERVPYFTIFKICLASSSLITLLIKTQRLTEPDQSNHGI